MSGVPIDAVLDRLAQFHVRPNGLNRWRACCPAHGGKNRSALSVGIGRDDAVLLRCWTGCEAHEVAHALGLELHELFPPTPQDHSTPKPRRVGMLTAGQALELLKLDANLIWTAACNLAAGYPLTDQDRELLSAAAGRIDYLSREANA